MKMGNVIRLCAPKGSLTKQDQLAKTFLFRRSHPALGKSVQVRTPRRQDQAFRARGFEDRSKGGAELGVAIVQDLPLVSQMTGIRIDCIPRHLFHPHRVWMSR
jgi:hypothetical protein